MPARKALPSHHHVMRFASLSKRQHHPDGTVTGPSPAAYVVNERDKGGLSVTWIEFFGDHSPGTRAAAAAAYRESLEKKKLPPQGAFAWAMAAEIISAGDNYQKSLRIVHDPVDGNEAHAEIRHFDQADLDLLDFLAANVFIEYEAVREMNIPPRLS